VAEQLTAPTINVNRLRTHESGRGYYIVVEPGKLDSPTIYAPDGGPMTADEARNTLDFLDNLEAEKKRSK